ncbi:hypothetical protein BC827DRAFT_831634 [Russula dissimulans]|nr:hypothetical protein BC827DRAFT_831634 [Russula dissimulans]
MPFFLTTSIRLPSIGRHRRKLGAPSHKSKQSRYTLLFHEFLRKHGQLVIDNIVHLSASSMTTRFYTYFVSVALFFQMKRKATIGGSFKAEIGIANAGATSLSEFAKDGGVSYLDRHPTSVSPSFVPMALRWPC